MASTVDPVGSDRIELHGEHCSLMMDEHELRVGTFDGPAQRLSDESTNHFDRVPVAWEDVAVPPVSPGGYDYMMEAHRDFVQRDRGAPAAAHHTRRGNTRDRSRERGVSLGDSRRAGRAAARRRARTRRSTNACARATSRCRSWGGTDDRGQSGQHGRRSARRRRPVRRALDRLRLARVRVPRVGAQAVHPDAGRSVGPQHARRARRRSRAPSRDLVGSRRRERDRLLPRAAARRPSRGPYRARRLRRDRRRRAALRLHRATALDRPTARS